MWDVSDVWEMNVSNVRLDCSIRERKQLEGKDLMNWRNIETNLSWDITTKLDFSKGQGRMNSRKREEREWDD